MSDVSFNSILDTPASQVESPRPLPPGTYHCVVDGQYKEDKSSKKGTPYVQFALKPMSALDDVDKEALEEALTGADGNVKPLADKRIYATYYTTPDALYRLKKFLVDDCQIPEGKKKIRQLCGEAQNQQVLASIKHVPSTDGESIYAQLASTAPVE